jgi:quercetin dioxygenase-like cupin family protein
MRRRRTTTKRRLAGHKPASGWVATETERFEIKVGDVAHVKAGERHWHGAKADTTLGHITITLASGKATWG